MPYCRISFQHWTIQCIPTPICGRISFSLFFPFWQICFMTFLQSFRWPKYVYSWESLNRCRWSLPISCFSVCFSLFFLRRSILFLFKTFQFGLSLPCEFFELQAICIKNFFNVFSTIFVVVVVGGVSYLALFALY